MHKREYPNDLDQPRKKNRFFEASSADEVVKSSNEASKTPREITTPKSRNSTASRLKDLLQEAGWIDKLGPEMEKDYFRNLESFVQDEWSDAKKAIYPPPKDIFRAFNMTPYEKVCVVILGQDPYHSPRQATGLSFSVPRDVRIPSSLVNIYKEIKSDVGYYPGNHGNLSHWAQQGVLLLNTVLTVRRGEANSHKSKGWETFTDAVIQCLNNHESRLVFILWGNQAKIKGKNLDKERHCVIMSAHPSGLSAHKGFFGSKPFSKCNDFLQSSGSTPIDWKVEPSNQLTVKKD